MFKFYMGNSEEGSLRTECNVLRPGTTSFAVHVQSEEQLKRVFVRQSKKSGGLHTITIAKEKIRF